MDVTNLLNALHRGGFEVVNSTQTPNQIRLIGRIGKDRLSTWLVVVQHLCKQSGGKTWAADVSKYYFLRADDRLQYGWRIILQGEDIASRLEEIIRVLTTTPPHRTVVDELPLMGASASRNALSPGGKGAQGVNRPVVGAAAVMQAQVRATGAR